MWIVKFLRRTWRACRGKGINQTRYDDPETQKALAELMGSGSPTPEFKRIKKKQRLIRYTKGNSDESDGAEYVQKA